MVRRVPNCLPSGGTVLTEYLRSALALASYELLEDGTYSGEIEVCPGTIAFGSSLSECQRELRSALGDWLMNALRHGDELPVIDEIDLNITEAA